MILLFKKPRAEHAMHAFFPPYTILSEAFQILFDHHGQRAQCFNRLCGLPDRSNSWHAGKYAATASACKVYGHQHVTVAIFCVDERQWRAIQSDVSPLFVRNFDHGATMHFASSPVERTPKHLT